MIEISSEMFQRSTKIVQNFDRNLEISTEMSEVLTVMFVIVTERLNISINVLSFKIGPKLSRKFEKFMINLTVWCD